MTLRKTSPTSSMPVITFLPSVAASSTATGRNTPSIWVIGATLSEPSLVRGEGARDGLGAGDAQRHLEQRARVAAEPERVSRLVEPTASEQRRGGRPSRAVVAHDLGPPLPARPDELPEDGRHDQAPERGDERDA